MLRASDVKVGDIIATIDTRTGKPWTEHRIVTRMSGPYEGDNTVYVTFVKSNGIALDTGALSDGGDGLETTFNWEEYRVVGHTDIASRMADMLARTINWKEGVA